MNLATNAGHSMQAGGVLEISVDDEQLSDGTSENVKNLKPGNYLKISVSDSGTGIDPDIMESIFEPYFTTKQVGEGTGMGLAVVYGIVRKYNGEITVQSVPGRGSTFTIYFPTVEKRHPDEQYQVEKLPLGTERILFVDDELPIAEMGRQVLEKLGYTVKIRTSSIEALALFQSRSADFDLVITDMTMPNMTGDKLAMEMMKIRPDIPVILCTGYSKKISEEAAAKIGIKALIHKPLARIDLARIVRNVLDKT